MLNLRNSSTLYVDQKNGKDKSYNGLSPKADALGNGPLQSLDFALKLIANLRATGDQRPITLALCEDYYLKKPLCITQQMSGLTLESFGTRRRVIGGFPLTGWEKDEWNGHFCLSAFLPEEKKGMDFSDLYVNGVRAKTTRYPKEGTLKAAECENKESMKTVGLSHHSRWFRPRPEDLGDLEDVENAWVNYYHYWIDEHSPVASYEKETGRITMAYASRFTLTADYEKRLPSDMHYYLTNVPSSFGEAGEWYYHKKQGKLYYLPKEGERAETLEVLVPLTDRLLEIRASDVRIRNLELCVTKCEYESRAYGTDEATGLPLLGEEPFGSDIQSLCYAHGAIGIRNSQRVSLSDCHLHSLGIYAVLVEEGCHHIVIEENLIEDVAAGGIKIFGGHYGSPEGYHTHDCVIRSNEIRNLGRRYEAGCGILLCHAHHNLLENNHIHHGGYSGISVGWVWGYGDNQSCGNRICRNHIHHLGNGALSDMGGIYTLGKQPGTVISENRIHHVACENYGAWGIYLDEGSSFITVENNVVYDTGTECFFLHYGSHNLVKNNIFAGTSGYSPVGTVKNELLSDVLLEQNILVSYGAPIYYKTSGANTLASRGNLLWDMKNSAPVLYEGKDGRAMSLEQWQRVYGQDSFSRIGDPCFVCSEKRDFRLSPQSPAYEMGFRKIRDEVCCPEDFV